LEHAIAPELAERREHLRPTRTIAQILQDHRILGQHLAAVEFKRGDSALGIHGEIVAAILELLGFQIDPFGIVIQADLVQQDVWRLGASAWGIIELHRTSFRQSPLPTSLTSGLSSPFFSSPLDVVLLSSAGRVSTSAF